MCARINSNRKGKRLKSRRKVPSCMRRKGGPGNNLLLAECLELDIFVVTSA